MVQEPLAAPLLLEHHHFQQGPVVPVVQLVPVAQVQELCLVDNLPQLPPEYRVVQGILVGVA